MTITVSVLYGLLLKSDSFFFNDTATTEIYTLSLHDALPISMMPAVPRDSRNLRPLRSTSMTATIVDRKSTRLNSSHQIISYAVFCLKKKISVHTKCGLITPCLVVPRGLNILLLSCSSVIYYV